MTEPNVTAILRKTGGAKPNKTEGGKSFTAKALPPSFLYDKLQLVAKFTNDKLKFVEQQIAADETSRLADLPGSSKGDERNDSEKVFERINQSR
ncbi:MAG TPA: hypothetical protein VGQ72_06845 [Pyrinomonadaceae bacterium]|nr:hypothetical protein [Pyrinomonadaceae bacterium]